MDPNESISTRIEIIIESDHMLVNQVLSKLNPTYIMVNVKVSGCRFAWRLALLLSARPRTDAFSVWSHK